MAEENIQKKTGAERQTEILVAALEKAGKHEGVLLNSAEKQMPRFYEKGLRVNPVNALIMAIHSDLGNFKTNSYTLFNESKKRGEAVKRGMKGVPFTWTNANEYVNKANPEDKISRAQFKELPEAEQAKYKVNPREDTYTLFNIDQTTMSSVHKEEYDGHVSKYGAADIRLADVREQTNTEQEAGYLDKEDMKKRMDVNLFIRSMKENLVPVRRDASGIAHYDNQKDAVYMPAQNSFSSYRDYVQEVARQVVHATGIPQRLGREGVKSSSPEAGQKELLVEDLASAVKMLDFGMQAKLRPETMEQLPSIIAQLKENPKYAADVLHDVNRTVGMIKKAENGEKIELIQKPSEKRQQEWAAQFPLDKVPEKFNAVAMLKDDAGKWTLVAKADNVPVFAVHPSKEDTGMYFDVIKNDRDEAHVQEFRTQMAQKYYSVVANNPSRMVPLFRSNASKEALDLISKVNAFKTKDSKILLVASIGDEKQKPVEVSQSQWQRMWLADDKQDYKTHLAATLYADVLSEKLGKGQDHAQTVKQEEQQQQQQEQVEVKEKQEEKRQNSPEQKEKERIEEEKKEEATKQETKAVAAVALSPLLKQFMDLKEKHPDALLLFRVGDFYETYQKDARAASEILGITLARNEKMKGQDGKPVEMAGFPHHALDYYLPKLIRAGQRVAICDQLEKPQQVAKRGQVSVEPPVQEQKVEQKQEKQEEQVQHRGMHR